MYGDVIKFNDLSLRVHEPILASERVDDLIEVGLALGATDQAHESVGDVFVAALSHYVIRLTEGNHIIYIHIKCYNN
jgi:hypothetical protein